MKSETLNANWKTWWPEAVHNYKGFSLIKIHHSAVDKEVKLTKLLGGDGLTDMATEDVNNPIVAHSDALMDKDLTEIIVSK